MQQMIDIAVVCIGACFSVLALINGVYMLASPRAWFHLPRWLRASGSLSERKYSRGWGALQVRFLGGLVVAFFLVAFGSIVYDEFMRPQ